MPALRDVDAIEDWSSIDRIQFFTINDANAAGYAETQAADYSDAIHQAELIVATGATDFGAIARC